MAENLGSTPVFLTTRENRNVQCLPYADFVGRQLVGRTNDCRTDIVALSYSRQRVTGRNDMPNLPRRFAPKIGRD